MALGTVTIIRREPVGSQFEVIAKINVTSGANYTTGGEPVTAAALGLLDLGYLAVIGPTTVVTKHVRVDNTNPKVPKLKVGIEDGTSGIEAEALVNSDQSAVQVLVLARGH